ncbi:MAG: ATP-dependent DNA helicase, partial [Acidimicrobiales bacterium]
MRGYDPDDDDVEVEVAGDGGGRRLDEEGADADVEAALSLLDSVTADLPGAETRDGQRAMTAAVARAWSLRRPVAVEAGTGIGKSLAYLVPSALAGSRVVVATATKNLQDQLASKDAPLVAAHSPGTRVAVLKGRQNYLCRLRAQGAGAGQLELDDGVELPRSVSSQMRRVLTWADTTDSGDRDELAFEVDERVWRQVSVTPQECLGRVHCPQGASCFTELARDRAAESSIVIVNTHLYAAHLASGSNLLPAHDFVVFDEAHEALNIFATMLGTTLTPNRARGIAASARPLLTRRDLADDLAAAAERLAAA